jgi:hypothetical protein
VGLAVQIQNTRFGRNNSLNPAFQLSKTHFQKNVYFAIERTEGGQEKTLARPGDQNRYREDKKETKRERDTETTRER